MVSQTWPLSSVSTVVLLPSASVVVIAAGGPVRNGHVLLVVVLVLVDQPALGIVAEIIVGIVGVGDRGQGVLRALPGR